MHQNISDNFADWVKSLGTREAASGVFAAWLAYWIAMGIYRVYFHPLAKFPGPKLAALTFWYEFYYDIYPHKFQYLWKIKELHEQYGPIVRINPLQIHIHDPEFYDKIYASGSHKRNRCGWSHHTGAKSFSGSMLEAMDHDLHKMRRNSVSHFFSKRSVQALEPLVIRNVDRLLQRLKEEMAKGGETEGIVNLNNAYAGMTMDIISEYCFGESMKSLDNPEYGKEWLDILHQGVQIRPLGRQFPTLLNFMLDLPPDLVAKLNPTVGMMNAFNHSLLRKIERIFRHEDESDGKKSQRTIFHEIRDDVGVKLPEAEKEPYRLMAEGSVFLGAGTETTARTLAVTTFYLIQNVEAGQKALEELKGVLPSKDTKVSLPQLEALPYFTAVINEGLRVAHGVSSRQPRVPTNESLTYTTPSRTWLIPAGTPVMESAYLIHTDPNIYPEPLAYRPERWLEDPKLTRYLVAFGRGSRSCLGMNLATSELYIGLAMIWRWLEMEIWDTKEERDVQTSYDCFLGLPSLESAGIKVKIIGERN